jgi:hypothetical protein
MNTTRAVDHPAHYTAGGVEVIDAIEAWQLGFHLGNTVKYVARAGKKDPAKTLEDLKKARWYLNREIERLNQAEVEHGLVPAPRASIGSDSAPKAAEHGRRESERAPGAAPAGTAAPVVHRDLKPETTSKGDARQRAVMKCRTCGALGYRSDGCGKTHQPGRATTAIEPARARPIATSDIAAAKVRSQERMASIAKRARVGGDEQAHRVLARKRRSPAGFHPMPDR